MNGPDVTALEKRTCSVDGCDRKVKARGRCNSHDRRWLAGVDLSVPIRTMDKLEEFHRLRSIATDECVIWPHATRRGYGVVRYLGRDHPTHRLALTLATSIDDPDLEAAHGPCHNPTCMNVRHLSWKTRAQNLADRDRDGTHLRGERHGNALLTEEDAKAILASTESRLILAERYGVTKSAIDAVKIGQNWRHIWDEVQGAKS